jgi:hypothetical protein
VAHELWINAGERGQAASAVTAGRAPDFVRHDRGVEDDHWARAFGAPCNRCGTLLEETDYARRSAKGGWVHESCPAPRTELDE